MKHSLLFACGFAMMALAGCGNSGSTTATTDNTAAASNTSATSANPDTSASKISIAVIPKGTTHVYWKSVQAGALKAGKELNVDIQWKGPLKESDRSSQIDIVNQFVSDGISGMVLAPLDDVALVKPVKAAADKKIPVIIIDSAIKGTPGKDYLSLVATDNYKGGVLAGERMVKLLNGKGKVAMLRYQEGSDSTDKREEGFLSVIKKNAGITMTVDNRYGGATASESKDAAGNMMDQLKESDGIYCPNESSTLGMLLALRQNHIAGKKIFVGFDTSPELLDALNKGEINALVAQNPTKMGYIGVKEAVAAIKGQKIDANVDTGVAVVDKTNVATPEIKALLG